MPVTLANLRDAVNMELENFPMNGSAESEGNGTDMTFLIAPVGARIVNDTTFAAFINGTLTTAYTMDYEVGVCTMTAAPAATETVTWQFTYVRWTDDLVTNAINAGINNLFPALYVQSYDDTYTPDGATYEFSAPAGAEYITSVDSRSSTTDPWSRLRRKRYEIIYDGGSPILRFFSAPTQGYLRIHYVGRPTEMRTDTPAAVAVSDISVANPSIVTTAAHGLTTGDLVYFTNVATTPEINLTYQVVTVIGATSFSIPVNVTVSTDDTGSVVFTDSLETTSKLPTRARDLVVSYACYYLLSQKMAPRVRSDVAVTTQNSGALLPSQMQLGGQAYMMRFQMQLASMRMSPWSSS